MAAALAKAAERISDVKIFSCSAAGIPLLVELEVLSRALGCQCCAHMQVPVVFVRKFLFKIYFDRDRKFSKYNKIYDPMG